MKKDRNTDRDIKPDLKHDSMEYAASTDGDDILDPYNNDEEDDLTAEELDLLEVDAPEELAAALNTVESDRRADNDVSFDVNDVDEEYDEEDQDADDRTRH
ncbi:MAG: hypothetical protein ABIN36_10865 [Ferruginibacter sp.]